MASVAGRTPNMATNHGAESIVRWLTLIISWFIFFTIDLDNLVDIVGNTIYMIAKNRAGVVNDSLIFWKQKSVQKAVFPSGGSLYLQQLL